MPSQISAPIDPVAADAAPLEPAGRQPRGQRHRDVVDRVRRMIRSGEFAPGEPLGEVAVSRRLAMSRTPVREAFRTLAAEGLVELLPNRRAIVRSLDEPEPADMFSVLQAMERLAVEQACVRMTDNEIARLSALQRELERRFYGMDRNGYVETDAAIRELLVEGARNSALRLAWRTIRLRAERSRALYTLNRRRWAAALEECRRICAAVCARDPRLNAPPAAPAGATPLAGPTPLKVRVRVKAGSAQVSSEAA